MTALTLGQIALQLGGTLDGDEALVIERVRGFQHAGAGEIAIVCEPRFYADIDASPAAAVVISSTCQASRPNVIRVPDAKAALGPLILMFAPATNVPAGVEAGAFVAESATLGARVFVASGACVGAGAILGDDVRIHANAVIGEGTQIGDASVIHPNVTLYPATRIGRRVVIHAGTVIGSDGFGYMSREGVLEKIPQIGVVEIEDDVEIGANCAIDRATLEVTRIRAGTKIDNLVQVGHNSEIGRNVVLVSQVGVSGSVTIGDGAMLGGQVGVADHVRVASGAVVGAQAGVHSDIGSGEWLGSPAIPRERAGRMFAVMPHLPDYRERVRALESRVAELETMIAQLRADGVLTGSRTS